MVKAHVGRWSEDCPEHQGCVVYSMADVPLGFGVVSSNWKMGGLNVESLFFLTNEKTHRLQGVRPRQDGWILRVLYALGRRIAESISVMKILCLLVKLGSKGRGGIQREENLFKKIPGWDSLMKIFGFLEQDCDFKVDLPYFLPYFIFFDPFSD